jgi:predicted SprT family Zn-dependent metalloprotease
MNENLLNTWAIECLNRLGKGNLWKDINWNISFKKGLTARCGDACYNRFTRTATIRISVDLWPYASMEQRQQTMFHEVCHIVDNYLASVDPFYFKNVNEANKQRRDAHGPSWRVLMVRVGMPPERVSDVKRPASMRKTYTRYVMKCGCREGTMSANKLTRLRNSGAELICKRCNKPFKVVNVQ